MPLGAAGTPGRLVGLCQWHRLGGILRIERVTRLIEAGAFQRGRVEELNLGHGLIIR